MDVIESKKELLELPEPSDSNLNTAIKFREEGDALDSGLSRHSFINKLDLLPELNVTLN